MLTFNADNATSNDKQTVDLARKKNLFEECNRGCCFNHMVQLAAKALIKPFTAVYLLQPLNTMMSQVTTIW